MNEIEILDQLAERVGIESGWWDFFGKWRNVSLETRRIFLTAMGFDISTAEATQSSLEEFDLRPWRRWLEPIKIFIETDQNPWVTLTVPSSYDKNLLKWDITEENGDKHSFQNQIDTLEWIEERHLDGQHFKRWKLHLPHLPPLGYHTLTVHCPTCTSPSFSMDIAVAPQKAYLSPCLKDQGRCWGISTQIYALRNGSDWGIGTYKTLADAAVHAAHIGASCLGVNPLHALFPDQPERFSPYAPSSRRFLATHFIDLETTLEFSESSAAKRLFNSPGFQSNLSRARDYPLVNYLEVARLQRPILNHLYQHFTTHHLNKNTKHAKEFKQFLKKGGKDLESFCLFDIIRQTMVEAGHGGYWKHWPEIWQNPNSDSCKKLLKKRRTDVEYFAWLQFIANKQLAQAHQAGRDAGATIGIYRDLGVGLAGDGAEAWCGQDHLALGVSVGAPPDPLALKGQDWGLLPFNPITLREKSYAPFIAVIAENMRHAGAIRLDHAMSLQRLYWVPPHVTADQGGYVRYPVDDLFALVALESQRNKCLVIGEDLGTVPEGFRERMETIDIFGYRIMVFEKNSPFHFKPANNYTQKALATFATHDLPSLRSWWDGDDIEIRDRLQLYPQPDMANQEREQRILDRKQIITLLQESKFLSADFEFSLPLTNEQALTLSTVLHKFLAQSHSQLMMVQIEDVLGLKIQMNVPGTTDQHPNWQYRFPTDLDSIFADSQMLSLAEMLSKIRSCCQNEKTE